VQHTGHRVTAYAPVICQRPRPSPQGTRPRYSTPHPCPPTTTLRLPAPRRSSVPPTPLVPPHTPTARGPPRGHTADRGARRAASLGPARRPCIAGRYSLPKPVVPHGLSQAPQNRQVSVGAAARPDCRSHLASLQRTGRSSGPASLGRGAQAGPSTLQHHHCASACGVSFVAAAAQHPVRTRRWSSAASSLPTGPARRPHITGSRKDAMHVSDVWCAAGLIGMW
jgi:hypothetical protein